MRGAIAIALGAALLAVSGGVRADEPAPVVVEAEPNVEEPLVEEGAAMMAEEPGDPITDPVEYERRGGLTFGLQVGGAAGVASGYPNDALKLDRPQFRTETGAAGGGAGSGWVGVAFTDWLTFGLAGYGGALASGDYLSYFGAFSFHVDVYPAYGLGGAWRDAGVMLEAGIGVGDTLPYGENELVIESGGASRFAGGLFWEGVRLGKVAMGPFAAADVMWSTSALRPMAWLGWRTSFYLRP